MSLTKEIQTEVMVGIGEVARMLDVASHTVRYWEKEFGFFINPPRTHGRQRRYNSESMEKLRQIKKLLKEDGYSIAGAKRFLMSDDLQELPEFESTQDMVQRITSMIRKELIQELAIGQSPVKV